MEKQETIIPGSPEKGNLLSRYFKTLPVFFPLIGLFLLGIALYEAISYLGDDSVSRLFWLRPLVLLLYFLFWAGACLARKVPAISFLVLTIVNVSFYLFGPHMLLWRALGDLLFIPLPVNLLFAFLLLFFFRKMK
ncbi:hypothetical protein [Taibaiella koreensis]|uniref:hypothetical protein n=1 Tax=Taibaiella koreensis TaxID=1268548 RepID=UPI000E5A0808|nr:hypothetical protein [Taibaiella koreensis]